MLESAQIYGKEFDCRIEDASQAFLKIFKIDLFLIRTKHAAEPSNMIILYCESNI